MARDCGFWRRAIGGARAWRHDGSLRRRMRNVGHLLTGNLVGSLLGFVAVALTARALGPTDYGLLALAFTYARGVERIVSFQTWQPLIKYGAALQAPEQRDDLKALLKFGLLLDIAAAVVAWLVATGGAFAVASFFGWSDRALQLITVTCTILLFQLSGMPTAVLRIWGRFRRVAYGTAAGIFFRTIGCAIGLLTGADLVGFALIWTATQILGSLLFFTVAVFELRRQGIRGLLGTSLRGVTTRFPGLWGFTWSANLSLTLRSSAHELDTLIVGALSDPASAGLYHIAKRIGRLGQQVGNQVQAVLYPDIARLWAGQAVAAFRRAVAQVEVMLFCFGVAACLFFLVAAEPLLRWSAGPEFVAAAPLVIIQMVAVTMTLTGVGLRSALLAMGHQQQVLGVVAIATAGFHLTAFSLVPLIGAMGANIAHIVMGAIFAAGLSIAFRHALKRGAAALQPDTAPSVAVEPTMS